MSDLTFQQKLVNVQSRLVAKKDKENKFGGYAFRTAEGIIKSVKPLLAEHGLFMLISDEVVTHGEGDRTRFYVEATVSVTDGETHVTSKALAREPLEKKGSDASQITGAASSYARKYALNGLFGIDDGSQDPDTNHGSDAMNAKVDEALASCSTREEAIEKMRAICSSPKANPAVKKYATAEFNRLFPAS